MLVYHVGQKWRENLQPIPYIRSKHVETKVKAFVSQNNIFHLLQQFNSLYYVVLTVIATVNVHTKSHFVKDRENV